MAGLYPDVPSHRMPYHADGSVVFRVNGDGTPTEMSAADVAKMNDEGADYAETNNSVLGVSVYVGVLFPEKRNLLGYFLCAKRLLSTSSYLVVSAIEVSSDSTNGADGTWTSLGAPESWEDDPAGLSLKIRENIASVSQLGITGVRFNFYLYSRGTNYKFAINAMHFYGVIASGENPNRLELWDSAGTARLGGADMDWGNAARGSSDDIEFTVKNLSATQTANDIIVAIEASPTETTPPVAGQHLLSDDGVNFASYLEIGNLAPGAVSSVLTLRRITPDNAVLGLWVAKVVATPDSMT